MSGNPLETSPTGGDSNKFFGEYVARVESIDDPKEWYRVQVRVFAVFTPNVPKKDLPWAEIKLPLGARPNEGFAVPLKPGDLVWVDFPHGPGDTRRPRITGSVHYCPENHPNLPHEAWGGPSAYLHKRTGDEPLPASHGYHQDEASTVNGVTIERNKDGSYAVYQRTSGTELTITKDGDMIWHVEGDIYRSTTKGNSKAYIDGSEDIFIRKGQKTTAMEGIDHDGGTGNLLGVRNGHHICSYTRKPVAHISGTVRSTE